MHNPKLNPSRLNDNSQQVEIFNELGGTVFSPREALRAKDTLRLGLKAVHQIGHDLNDGRLVAIALRCLLSIRALS